jgi:hypothetical protein
MNSDLHNDGEIAAVATSNYVYVQSKDFAWVPARVVEVRENEAVVQVHRYPNEQAIVSDCGRSALRGSEPTIVKLADYPNNALPLQNISEEGILQEVEDMVDLPFLHEVSTCYCMFRQVQYSTRSDPISHLLILRHV